MSLRVRKHNIRARQPNWWRRYFWSQSEYWAKHAVYKAAIKARTARIEGDGTYYFWNNVCKRASQHCEKRFGPTPDKLLKRPIDHSPFSLSSPEINKWLMAAPHPKLRRD